MRTAEQVLPRIEVHRGERVSALYPRWRGLLEEHPVVPPSSRPEWISVLQASLQHEPYCVVAESDGSLRGVLPLMLVRSRLFGRFLVGLPYLNSGGVLASDRVAGTLLIDRAVELADQLDVDYLELRHEQEWTHASLRHVMASKVHMRLALPRTSGALWESFKPKVRSQVRKATKNGLTVHWGGHEMLADFYRIFTVNMRDLGTPAYSRRLFEEVLRQFSADAEICVVRSQGTALAAGLLVHGRGAADVPSASSLRRTNRLNGNMLLYWHLLCRAIERGQAVFDFGRCTAGSSTYRFKRQWGAEEQPAVWQYYVRRGSIEAMRPESPRNQRRVQAWRRLPVWLTRLLGPPIVRGIP